MTVTPTQIEQRQQAAVKHGARSEARIAAIARSKKRWLLLRSDLTSAE